MRDEQKPWEPSDEEIDAALETYAHWLEEVAANDPDQFPSPSVHEETAAHQQKVLLWVHTRAPELIIQR